MTPSNLPARTYKANAAELLKRWATLKSDASAVMTLNQDIADYVMPRKSNINRSETKGASSVEPDLYNLTAVRAAQVLAGGMKDYLFSGTWFRVEAPVEVVGKSPEGVDDEASRWCQQATEIMQRELARSNFYTEIHECLLDRSTFTHADLWIEEGKRSTLYFRNDDVGTYFVAEDEEGYVDTVFRELKLTARQATMQFGEGEAGKAVADAMRAGKLDQQFTFIHAIYPRPADQIEAGKQDAPNMPIASCYLSCADKVIVRESGYPEMPCFVTRHLKWGNTPYGYAPSIEALPTIRQVNYIERNMDALAEIKAFPRYLYPDGWEGQVDLRSGMGTPFDPNMPGARPEIWGTEGEYDIGLERIKSKDDFIRECFHVDLFNMLKDIERQMTAYEVQQRLQEKLSSFSPTFYRLDGELVQPMLRRVFSILYRLGKLGQAPQSMMVTTMDGSAQRLAMPEFTLTGKLALAIRAAENQAFGTLMEVLAPLVQVAPDIVDNFDMDKSVRGIASNLMVPVRWQRSRAEVEEIRATRAQAQAQAAQLEAAESMARTAKDAGAAQASGLKLPGGAA